MFYLLAFMRAAVTTHLGPNLSYEFGWKSSWLLPLFFFPHNAVLQVQENTVWEKKMDWYYSFWDSHYVAQARPGFLDLQPYPLEWSIVKSQRLSTRVLPSSSPGICKIVLYGQCHGCPLWESWLENRRLLARDKMISEEFKFFNREVGGHHPYS